MKRKILLLTALSVFSVFTACDYERPELLPVHNQPVDPEVPVIPEEPEAPTAAEFNALHTAALESLKQQFTFDGAAGSVTFTSQKGVILTLNTSCLTKNGNSVTGEVQLEYVEVFNKGNMLTANKPTMGVMPNGDKALLISGGEFYINATQDGVQLTIGCGMQLKVPANLTGGTDAAMSLWYGMIDAEGNIVWDDAAADNPNQEVGVGAEGNNYYCYFNHFGWTNVDRFYSDPRPKTTIYVDVPEGYDDTNCAVYLAYVGETNALALLDTYDDATGLFSEHYGLIPIGLECYVIFVSEEDGEWTYAIKAVTIVEGQIITITDAELDSITEAELIAAIDALP
jgi:hypothetical protein